MVQMEKNKTFKVLHKMIWQKDKSPQGIMFFYTIPNNSQENKKLARNNANTDYNFISY